MLRGFFPGAIALPLAFSAAAGSTFASPPPVFDRPVSVQHAAPKSEADPDGAQVCTAFRDLMIRETGTDTPAPGAASLVSIAAGQKFPLCKSPKAAGEKPLKTDGFSFLGRKGAFLLFGATDPNGAVPFKVLSAVDGGEIFADEYAEPGFGSLAIESGALHLYYARAVNASCSLLKNGAACWTEIARDASLPPEIATLSPPGQACAVSYRKGKAPADDPSLVSYDVEAVIRVDGAARIAARGPVKCDPMP